MLLFATHLCRTSQGDAECLDVTVERQRNFESSMSYYTKVRHHHHRQHVARAHRPMRSEKATYEVNIGCGTLPAFRVVAGDAECCEG